MPYFPEQAELIYQCRGCGKWFIPGNVSCGVLHSAGTCCHYGETETIEPRREKPTMSDKLTGAAKVL